MYSHISVDIYEAFLNVTSPAVMCSKVLHVFTQWLPPLLATVAAVSYLKQMAPVTGQKGNLSVDFTTSGHIYLLLYGTYNKV